MVVVGVFRIRVAFESGFGRACFAAFCVVRRNLFPFSRVSGYFQTGAVAFEVVTSRCFIRLAFDVLIYFIFPFFAGRPCLLLCSQRRNHYLVPFSCSSYHLSLWDAIPMVCLLLSFLCFSKG